MYSQSPTYTLKDLCVTDCSLGVPCDLRGAVHDDLVALKLDMDKREGYFMDEIFY